MLHFSHSVEIRSQFFNGRFQVVNSFQAILEETEQKQRRLEWWKDRLLKKNWLQQLLMYQSSLEQDLLLLALCVEVFDEVLQQINAFLDFDLIDFK